MTRSFDTIPDEADRSADPPKPSVPVMSVCPFCGAIAEKCDGPCPRCKMENSAVTRQATRARIGPWYVMQSRNPSAPGMKFNTLLALIRKGQITPRSVIRGPTTFQLWRFAARVKGISREFGLCYSCGAELQRTSTFCPRCSRSQELPPNPDVLLETEPQPAKAVYREVSPRPATPGDVAPESPPPAPRPTPPAEPEPIRPTPIPSAAETMAELAEIPSPGDAPAALQSRARQRPVEGVLSARELAAAFSLQYDPTMDVPGAHRRRGRGKGLLAAAVLLLAVGGAVATFYFLPSLRQSFMAWIEGSSPAGVVGSSVSQSTQPKPLPDPTPDWMTTVPNNPPPITAPPKPQVSGSSLASNDVVPNNSAAGPAKPTPPANIVPVPTPLSDSPAASGAPVDPRTTAAAEATEKLRASAGNDRDKLDKLAMQLRINGMDAEGHKDYIAAQYYYQQVETLPRDHWPSDIDHLLKEVQKHLVPSDAH
jgi:hypothetical protein